MPNWCNNTLQIRGSAENLEKIKNQVKKPYIWKGKTLKQDPDTQKWDLVDVTEEATPLFAFQNIIPQPEFTGDEDWYSWRLKNWDTKWDASEVTSFLSQTQLNYSFDTAWSPPMKVYYELSRQYPDVCLVVKYEEPGMGFMGVHIIKNGEDINSHYTEEMSHLTYIMQGEECYCESLDWEEGEEAPFFDCPIRKENNKEEING